MSLVARPTRQPRLSVRCLCLLVALGCLLAGGCSRPRIDASAPPPNVVLISIDTLRADRLSLYGHDRPTSPNLEQLAQEAVVFERFLYSGGGTLPSHMSMMTSLNPITHGITNINKRVLEDQRVTLAEQLKEAGYTTAGFADGSWVQGRFGFAQGFDLYDDSGGHFRKILPRAMAWIRKHRDEPFFLFLHTFDVHSSMRELPYECPDDLHELFSSDFDLAFDGCRDGRCASELLAWANSQIRSGEVTSSDLFTADEVKFMAALYDGCIRYVDREIGRLIRQLERLGIYDRTLLVVTSDHGEEFAEHGMFLHLQGGYEELSRIPLIFKLPGSEHGGTRVAHLAAMVDLMPTVLDVLDIPLNDQAQGTSLLPAIAEDVAAREAIHMYRVVSTGRYKYFSKTQELYDLLEDPREQKNLFSERPEVVAHLEELCRSLSSEDQRRGKAFRAKQGVDSRVFEVTPEEEANLKALGYLGD